MSADLLESAARTSALEWLGVVLALAYLWLAVRQHLACWAFAIASSLAYLLVFARAGLPMQAALQLFYVAMAAYGWWHWRGGEGVVPAQIQRWPWPRHLAVLGAILAVSLANGAWLAQRDGAGLVPYADATLTWASVATTWMVARKVLENWLYWIVIDLAAAALYWQQGLVATALLFLAYAAIALHGYRRWRAEATRAG